MRTRTLFSSGLLSFLIAGAAFAQPITTKDPRAQFGPPPKAKAEVVYSSRQVLEKGVTLARITNGMTVIVQENHSAPIATVRCYVRNTGGAYEGKHLGAGLSHMLEHMLAGGTTTKRTEVQIREIQDSLGGQTNAYTSNEVTAFHIDCPGSSASVAIELIAQNMQFSVIPEAEYVRELGVVQRELEMGEADRSRVLYNQMKQLVYLEHPIRVPTIGYLPVVQQVTRDDVIAFYKDRYRPQNMTFVVVGDVDTSTVLDDVLAAFKTFVRTAEQDQPLAAEPEQASPRSARLEMEGATTHLALAWPTVPLQDPDLYPLDLASFIMATGDSSRLTKRLKIEKPLASSVSCDSHTPGFVKGYFQITVQCDPDNLEESRRIVFEEIERLKNEPVSDAALAKAKRQKAAEHVFSQQSVDNQAEALSSSYRSTGDPLFDAHYVARIQNVTADQIQAVARKYFQADRLNTLLIEPIGSSSSADDKNASEAETPITKHVLPNGLVVLLKRQTTLPMVTVQAYVKAGAISDTAATSGLASLATELLERGTEKYNAEQIADYFDSIGGSLGLTSAQNTSYLQSAVLKEDLDQSLDYIYQVLFAPTLPEEEFENLQQIRLARIAARKANPQTEIMDFWAQQLAPDNPYSRTPTGRAETVSKLTVADCRKFHKTYFVPNNMVLAAFGDIEPEELLKKLTASFGEVPKADGFEWPKFPAEQAPLTVDVSKHLQNQKKNTAMVLLSFPSVSIEDVKTRTALDMLDAVLTGGGGAGGRLHEELRGEQLVYYVFGMQMTGFAPGYFNFLAQTRPESVPDVVGRIRANLDKIRNEGIPTEEFDKAREKLIISHALRDSSPTMQAFKASVDELYGFGYDYEKTFPERIGEVTVADVVAVVKKQFAHSLLVTTSPEPAPKSPEAAAKTLEPAPKKPATAAKAPAPAGKAATPAPTPKKK